MIGHTHAGDLETWKIRSEAEDWRRGGAVADGVLVNYPLTHPLSPPFPTFQTTHSEEVMMMKNLKIDNDRNYFLSTAWGHFHFSNKALLTLQLVLLELEQMCSNVYNNLNCGLFTIM